MDEKSDRPKSRKRKRITSEEQFFVSKRKMLQKRLFVGMTRVRKPAKQKHLNKCDAFEMKCNEGYRMQTKW